jgi:hypothetical protein
LQAQRVLQLSLKSKYLFRIWLQKLLPEFFQMDERKPWDLKQVIEGSLGKHPNNQQVLCEERVEEEMRACCQECAKLDCTTEHSSHPELMSCGDFEVVL